MFPRQFSRFFVPLLIFLLLIILSSPQIAFADDLASISDVMTRLKVSPTTSSHDITFTLGAGTALNPTETVAIDFHEDAPETDFTVAGAATVVGDLDFTDGGVEADIVDVDGDCTGHGGTDDIVASINDATGVLTFTACANYNLGANGSIINVEYGTAAAGPGTNRVTNPTVADTYVIDITAAGDTGKLAVAILDNEQVTVNATVDPTITFTLSANATNFGTLSTTSITTSAPNITLTISTNANNGVTITTQDAGDSANPGLYSAGANDLIGSADASYNNTTTLAIGSEGYGIQGATTGGGSGATLTIDARFDQAGNNVGGFELTPVNLATAGGALSGREVVVTHKAAISGLNKVGTYTDTLTYIATANF